MHPPPSAHFVVLNFTLETRDDGKPTQRTTTCGTFAGIEDAFATARNEAGRELRWRRAESQAAPVELLDTEWGYDLRRGFLVISRYWVHDHTPSVLTP
jgi:hypothetical protein